MASVTSLGIHKPSAIPFLVAEGILTADPSEDTYTWDTGADICSVDGVCDEELLTTEYCVVWSRGGTIRRTFRLDVEGERVTKALFAYFPIRPQKKNPIAGQTRVETLERDEGLVETVEPPRYHKLRSKSLSKDHDKAHATPVWPPGDGSLKRRALVIVLKTQAQIYFLSQTSHIIHLPFEVESVFPLPRGILLQRKNREQDLPSASPQMPAVPVNTFVLSQASASRLSDHTVAISTPSSDITSHFSPLVKDLLHTSIKSSMTRDSGMVCLIDPLSEMGAVVTKNTARTRHSYAQRSSDVPTFETINPDEHLIYVSPQDDLKQLPSAMGNPLTLAVTQNRTSGKTSLWAVSYLNRQSSKNAKAQPSGSTGASFSRRQSSFSVDTGTATPRRRDVGPVRESVARSMSQDPGFNYGNHTPNVLDIAFEDPKEPAESSRRVSSLLARADLAASNDRTTFTDTKGGHGKRSSRRGASSFGPHTSRPITIVDGASRFKTLLPLSDIRSSMDSVTLSDAQLRKTWEGDLLDDDHEKSNNQDFRAANSSNDNLRKEIMFQMIYSAHGSLSYLPNRQANNQPLNAKVLVVRSPDKSLGSPSNCAAMTVFIGSRSSQDLLVLHVKATKPHHSQRRDAVTTKLSSRPWKTFRVSESKLSGILDITIVGEGDCRHVLTLSGNPGGTPEILLQTPWCSLRKIELPTPLNLYNHFEISSDFSLQRREGGFKRVLSGGPQSLDSLQHGSLRGRVDVVDTEGSRHCIYIQFKPKNAFVLRIIEVCEAILPKSPRSQEAILQAWCDVASWLRSRSEEDIESEWTAVIVVLFSMATPFIPDRRADAVKQQKRRKGGLLRSSSGANTDLGSWETMINQEHDLTSTTPTWMDQGPWKWTRDEEMSTHPLLTKKPKPSAPQSSPTAVPIAKKSSHILQCMFLSQEFIRSSAGQNAAGQQGFLPTAPAWDTEIRQTTLASILIALHLLREEYKLDILAAEPLHKLTPILAQIGGWLGWQNWGCKGSSFYMTESTDMEHWLFDDSMITSLKVPPEPFPPPSIFRHIESTNLGAETAPFVSLLDVASPSDEYIKDEEFFKISQAKLLRLTPRTMLINNLLAAQMAQNIETRMLNVTSCGLTESVLETLPESVAVSFRTAILACQGRPSTAWNHEILELIGRDDLAMLEYEEQALRGYGRPQIAQSNEATQDVHSICHMAFEVEMLSPYDGSAEVDRQSVTRLLFKDDQRFAEAAKLLHPLLYPVAKCAAEPEWSDTDLLEAQQELVKIIAMRTLSVSLGRALVFYNARMPVLTEKFPIHGFTLSCVMKPGDTTVTADRTAYTEEKVSWAFFHAGVEAGLSISKEAQGVNTSWILFNKPRDLSNRHAGFLLAMGLNGHLKSIAKWVAFKYLTPKHSMTSVGLLLGLSASHLGTMDTLVTRLLSIHVTRMLPLGAAELNLSPLTQTSGIMGIGLLYCNTQHRRMSEIMLSDMENVDEEDGSNPLESLRDEGYRLAAGFALGYINLGRGKDLKGLHDMHITERLLVLAVAAKRADRVHVLDRATAGATVATALIFMKSQDTALARKIDIPDTLHQFEYIRPDHFLLRTVAKHMIMWDDISATFAWMKEQLPPGLQKHYDLKAIRLLTSEDLPMMNIIAGLCFAIGLRYAGSGAVAVRDLLCHYLNHFMRICRLPTLNYDGKLTRITVRNCQDLVALSAACVMAGSGDIQVFRRLRSLHGRTDAETPYGSHLATHFAIGVLFLGGGTHTFGTSNLAVASLLCAFYPLFPTTVLDNKSHLQAFRHFWVLATERRCLVARDVDTQRPLSVPILVTLKETDSQTAMTTPCPLPDLHTIAKIQTNDPEFWCVTLDLLHNPKHTEAFKRHQSIFLRRRAPYDAHTSIFSATMQALNDSLTTHTLSHQPFNWIFSLPAFRRFDRADQAMLLPNDPGEGVYKGIRGTALDDRLVLESASLGHGRSERLWNLRILLAWAEGRRKRGEGVGEGKGWIGKEVIERLRAGIVLSRRREL